MSKSFLGMSNLPRGLRNNNPGNLILTSIGWQGKVPNNQNTDKHFEQFTGLKWGIRAMFRDILNDISKGKNTVEKLITEYAPPHENNTQNYINVVSKALGVSPADKITAVTDEFLLTLGKAILKIENGAIVERYIDDSDIKEGISIIGDISGYGLSKTESIKTSIEKAIDILKKALLVSVTVFCLFF